MRVSFNLMSNNVLGNLFRNSEKLLNAQRIVATGKMVNKPSDDPIAMGKILDYRKILSSIDQYKKNIVNGKTRIDVSLTVMDSVSQLLTDAKNIAIDQASANVENSNREVAAIQIKEIRDRKKEDEKSMKDIFVERYIERMVTSFNCSKKELEFKLALFFQDANLEEMKEQVKQKQDRYEDVNY